MSRSNPTENSSHPCTRWIEWNGEHGVLSYYNKAEKKDVPMGAKFVFILLDVLATIKGWHDASESGIYSNEVKDTRQEPFVVKAFKGGELASGIYAGIKDRVGSMGGHFTANLYIAFRDDAGPLQIGSLQFKGAALREWMEFSKKNRADLYKKALAITGFTEGKKGKVTYRVPTFAMRDITPETDEQATALDTALQAFLKSYFSRTTVERAATQPAAEPEEIHASREQPAEHHRGQIDPDDIPF